MATRAEKSERAAPLSLACLFAVVALAATAGPAAGALPSSGFLVFKDTLRGEVVVEVRDDSTGRVVAKLKHLPATGTGRARAATPTSGPSRAGRSRRSTT